MGVRAAVSDQTHPHTRGVVYTSNSAAVHAINGLRVRHGHEDHSAQQYCSDEQSCAQPALARVRTPPVQDLDVLGAGRAAPGVLAVVSRSVHFSWYTLLFVAGARRRQVCLQQLRLELKNARDDGVFVRNRCSTVRYGCAQFLELRRDPIAAFTAAEHQLTLARVLQPLAFCGKSCFVWNFPKCRRTACISPFGELERLLKQAKCPGQGPTF